MARKITFAILAFALGSFIVSRVAGFPAKIATNGAVAWAEDSVATDDTAQNDSDADAIQSDLNKTSPPDVHGTWCGSINDNLQGLGSISMAIGQKRSKLSGS